MSFFDTIHLSHRPRQGARRNALRLAAPCAVVLASLPMLMAGPAQARIERPQGAGSHAAPHFAPSDVSPTRVTGLYGVHVEGGWLLR
jgi:hypothetical protein